jgi:hypothetical protein
VPAGHARHLPAGISEPQNDPARCPAPCRDAHPAAAQLLDDAVVRDGLPNELGGCAHLVGILGRQSLAVKRDDHHRLGKVATAPSDCFLGLVNGWSKRASPQQPQANESISPKFRILMVSPVYLLTTRADSLIAAAQSGVAGRSSGGRSVDYQTPVVP